MLAAQIAFHSTDIGGIAGGLEVAFLKVAVVVPIVHGKGVEFPALFLHDLICQRGEQAGIQSAGQECSNGHIGDHLPPDGIRHQFPHMGGGVGKVLRMFCGVQFPVGVEMQLPLHVVAAVCRLHLPYGAEHAAAGSPPRPHKQQFCNAGLVDLVGYIGVLEQCLDLGAKDKAVGDLRVKQRFYADAVPCQKQSAGTVLPDGKGKNAVALFHTAGAPVHIGLQKHFRVAVCLKYCALLFQLCPQFGGVVQLAIVDNGIGFSAGSDFHRLPALFHVNDRQPRVCHSTLGREKNALLVGAAALQCSLHFPQQQFLLPQVLFQMYHAGNSAHRKNLRFDYFLRTSILYAGMRKILQKRQPASGKIRKRVDFFVQGNTARRLRAKSPDAFCAVLP